MLADNAGGAIEKRGRSCGRGCRRPKSFRISAQHACPVTEILDVTKCTRERELRCKERSAELRDEFFERVCVVTEPFPKGAIESLWRAGLVNVLV